MQIFYSEENPNLQNLEKCNNCDLSLICDVQHNEEQYFYRLNDQKVIEWLKRKVDKIGEKVASLPGSMHLVRSQAAGYRAKKDEKLSNDQLVNLSLGFLSEYLPTKFYTMLADSYGVKISNHSTCLSFTETDHVVDVRYGTINEKRKAPDTPTTSQALKKRRIRAHEKIDTKNIKKLTSFFTVKKAEEPTKEDTDKIQNS